MFLNMESNKKYSIPLLSPLTVILFLAFFIAKVFNLIDWSWWLVTCPLWLPLAGVVFVGVVLSIGYLILKLICNVWK